LVSSSEIEKIVTPSYCSVKELNENMLKDLILIIFIIIFIITTTTVIVVQFTVSRAYFRG